MKMVLLNRCEKHTFDWCCPCASSVQTWQVFYEEAARETMALGIVDEKLKEGVKTEKNEHTNLKV